MFSDFEFLNGEKLFCINTSDLQKRATKFALKYSDNLNSVEILCEIV